MSPAELQNKETEIKNSRGLVIGLLGGVGVGKTTLAKELKKEWKVELVEEKFGSNPFLKQFYENPRKFAYRSQEWFLRKKVEQLHNLESESTHIIDPAIEMDYVYAFNLCQKGYLNLSDWDEYKKLYRNLINEHQIKCPDVYIAVVAEFKDIEDRIRRRNRKYELKILEDQPDYFKNLNHLTHKLAHEIKYKNPYKCMVIDSSHPDLNKSEEVKKEVLKRTKTFVLDYFKNNGDIVNGGTKIISPDFTFGS